MAAKKGEKAEEMSERMKPKGSKGKTPKGKPMMKKGGKGKMGFAGK